MSKLVEWSARAERDLWALPQSTQRKIKETLHRYAETDHGDVLKLKGMEDRYRLRVGDYRVIFTFRDGKLVILVLRVLDRKDAY